jgi:SRSO17 transposase
MGEIDGGGGTQRGSGLGAERLRSVRSRLVAFAAEMFEPLQHSSQRRWGEVYLRGLMLEGRRKSIEPMAALLPDGDEQALQQFVNQSPWDATAVRERLAIRISEAMSPEAWILNDSAFPKFGRLSVGVARQYCGELGGVANCQVGVSISAATEAASCPLDWRLFIPEEWDFDAARRAKAHVPDDVRHVPRWRLALEMADELRGWGLKPPTLLVDPGYGDTARFRAGLEARGLPYLIGVKGQMWAYAQDGSPPGQANHPGVAIRPPPRDRRRRYSLRTLALEAGPLAAVEVGWRADTMGERSSRFLALRVRPSLGSRASRQGTEPPPRWALCEWPEGATEPDAYWLSNLPAQTPLADLVRVAKLRWRVDHDRRALKEGLGLDHFEGRSYRGWNHHVTLVSLAQAFLILEQRRQPPAAATA